MAEENFSISCRHCDLHIIDCKDKLCKKCRKELRENGKFITKSKQIKHDYQAGFKALQEQHKKAGTQFRVRE